jgi:hypothetical protein
MAWVCKRCRGTNTDSRTRCLCGGTGSPPATIQRIADQLDRIERKLDELKGYSPHDPCRVGVDWSKESTD